MHFLAQRPCTKSNHINKDSMRLNLDHILVDLFENGSYLFILQLLDGYDYFACEVTCEKDNDHPPMRAGQHLLQSPFDQRCRSQEIFTKCVANGDTEDWLIFFPIYLLVIFCTHHLAQYQLLIRSTYTIGNSGTIPAWKPTCYTTIHWMLLYQSINRNCEIS